MTSVPGAGLVGGWPPGECRLPPRPTEKDGMIISILLNSTLLNVVK